MLFVRSLLELIAVVGGIRLLQVASLAVSDIVYFEVIIKMVEDDHQGTRNSDIGVLK